ncbi:MAG: hypothetical protein WC657_08350 [Candidatus Paceibacterota bacterium]
MPSLWNIFPVARGSAVQGSRRSNLGLWIFWLPGLRGPNPHWLTPHSLALGVAFKMDYRRRHIFLANVTDDLSLLASGIRACSAGEMPEVPKA